MKINLNYDREKERNTHIRYLKEHGIVLNDQESEKIRKMFIDSFIDTTTEYYKSNILYKINNEIGDFYQGYLWDTLKNYNRVQKTSDLDFLDAFKNKEVLVISDLHSNERLGNAESLLPFFPVKNVLRAKLYDVLSSLAALTQDLYIFDSSFSWYLILTHEQDEHGPEIYFYHRVIDRTDKDKSSCRKIQKKCN